MPEEEKEVGTIYLIHFDRPFKHARHYLGWTRTYNIEARLGHHLKGSGSRLMRAVSLAGIGWTVSRTWTGTRSDERRLHNRKKSPDLCPMCVIPKRLEGVILAKSGQDGVELTD